MVATARFSTRSEILHYYEKITRPYRTLGCRPECLKCDYLRRGQCTGGCLAHAIRSLHRLPPRLGPEPVRAAEKDQCC